MKSVRLSLYLCAGYLFVFSGVSIAQTPEPPQVMFSSGSLGGLVDAVQAEAETLYISRGYTLSKYRFADNAYSFLYDRSQSDITRDLVLEGDYLHQTFWGTDNRTRLRIYDLGASPTFLSYSSSSFTHDQRINGMRFSAGFLYLLMGESEIMSIRVLNASNPIAPYKIGSYTKDLVDFVPDSNVAYALYGSSWDNAGNEFAVLDISDKSGFVELGKIALPNGVDLIQAGNYVYAACEDSNGIQVIDVSTSGNPQIIGSYGQGALSFEQVGVINGHVIGDAQSGSHVIDVSVPTAPVKVSQFSHSSEYEIQSIQKPFIYGIEDGNLRVDDLSTPDSPELAAEFPEPAIPRNVHVSGRRFYTAGSDGKVYIYDIETPAEPELLHSFDVTDVNKAFGFGNLLFASDSTGKTYLYDISQVSNPQLKYTLDTDQPVRTIRMHDQVAYVMTFLNSNTTDHSELVLLNVANPDAVVKQATIPLAGAGRDLYVPSEGDLAYVAYGEKDGVTGFQIVDVSKNPAETINNTLTGIPQSIRMKNDLLFIAINPGTEAGEGRIEVYDVSTPSSPVLKQTVIPATGMHIHDLLWEEETLIVSLPDSGLFSYAYDSVNHTFIEGPTYEMHSPLNLAIYNVINSLSKSAGSGYDKYSLFIVGGLSYKNKIIGKLGVNVIAVLPGLKPNATLAIGMQPSEAGDAGCSISPDAGQYTYPKDAIVNIAATDNPEAGWFFTEWTGIGNNNPQVALLMNANKLAVANFAEVKLTISGKRERETYFPREALDEDPVHMLTVTVCASEVDGWNLSKLDFKASGTGNDLEDIQRVDIIRAGSQLFTGQYPANDGVISVSFNPPISIEPANCATFYVNYYFDYDAETYATHLIKSFFVETEAAVATPWTHENGLIAGQAKNQQVTIASVRNTQDYGFAYINSAVEDETTQNGDSIWVSPGVYQSGVNITKSIALIGVEGRSETFIRPLPALRPVISIEASDVTVRGLAVINITRDEYFYRTSGISIDNDNNQIYILDNYLESRHEDTIEMNENNDCVIENNIIAGGKRGLCIYKGEGHRVSNNSFMLDKSNCSPWCDYILIIQGGNHLISNNTASTDSRIYVVNSSNNEIRDNTIDGDDVEVTLRIHSGCDNNRVFNNQLTEFYTSDSEYLNFSGNTLKYAHFVNAHQLECHQNTLESEAGADTSSGLIIKGSQGVMVSENTIRRTYRGLVLERSHNVDVRENRIHENERHGMTIMHCTHVDITHQNRIFNNSIHGISINDASDMLIRDNYITDHDNGDLTGSTYGIVLYHSHRADIIGNLLRDNCTATYTEDCSRVVIGLNREYDALCVFTGFHLNNTSGEIYGNVIERNNGAGVMVENGSDPAIWGNNITDNQGAGIHNMDESVTIDASDNWWGDVSGPGPDDFTGNVDVTTWLAAPAGLLIRANQDTLYIPAGMSDSVFVSVANLSDPADQFKVSVQDSSNWLTGILPDLIGGEDSTSASFPIHFDVPVVENAGAVKQVIVSATSQGVYSVAVDTFYVAIYGQTLASLWLSPDSVEIEFGDTIQFMARGYDQLSNPIAFAPEWSATGGVINATGEYVAGAAPGAYSVTVQAGGLNQSVTVLVIQPTAVDEMAETIPQSFALLPNFPNPFNPTTTLRYQLSAFSRVKLEVFDLTGRLAAHLVDTEQNAGNYQVIFDGSGLSSGVYIVRMLAVGQGKRFAASQKVLLIK